MDRIDFKNTDIENINKLRYDYIDEIAVHVQDYIEEGITTYNGKCVLISDGEKEIGYVCIGTYDYYKDIILEYYVMPEYRHFSAAIVNSIKNNFNCAGWFVNTQDKISLPVMMELNLNYVINGYIFSYNKSNKKEVFENSRMIFSLSRIEEIDHIYNIITQDNFYTGGNKDTVIERIKEKVFFSFYYNDELVGVGFKDILRRTPTFADIGMVIDSKFRKKGFGTLILKYLIKECLDSQIIPTACCEKNNFISRKALENVGFYIDGCLLLADFNQYSMIKKLSIKKLNSSTHIAKE